MTAILAIPAVAEPPALITGFTHKLNVSLKVSGQYLAGFMLPTDDMSPDPAMVTVWLEGGHEKLCVSARTVDGYYESTAEFEIGTTAPGAYTIGLTLEDPDPDAQQEKEVVFSEYGTDELVLRGRVGADCNTPETLFEVPMTWGCISPGQGCNDSGTKLRTLSITEERPENLIYWIYLNSDRMETEVVIPGSSPQDATAIYVCFDVDTERRRRVFDKKCVIEYRDGLDANRARIDFFYRGETRPPEDMDALFIGSR